MTSLLCCKMNKRSAFMERWRQQTISGVVYCIYLGRKGYIPFGLRTKTKLIQPPPTIAFPHKSITNWSNTFQNAFVHLPLRILECLACLALIWTRRKRDRTVRMWSHIDPMIDVCKFNKVCYCRDPLHLSRRTIGFNLIPWCFAILTAHYDVILISRCTLWRLVKEPLNITSLQQYC